MGTVRVMEESREPVPPEMAGVIRSLQIDVATAEVVEAFRRAGIRALLLKGPALARWLYEREGDRTYVDCDLLVAPDQFAAAEAVLRSSGFKLFGLESIPGDWPRHARTWLRSDGVDVDLHHTLFGVSATPQELWEAVSADAHVIQVAGVDVEVMRPEARLLQLVLHSAKDGGREEKPLRDLQLALERLSFQEWSQAAVLAARLGATTAFTMGLRRLPAGRALAGELQLPYGTSTGLALRVHRAAPLSVGLDWLIASPGFKGKARLVLRKMVPPVAYMRAWTPLARGGRAGLAVAYGWRFLWVISRSGPALLAWQRARREAVGRPPVPRTGVPG